MGLTRHKFILLAGTAFVLAASPMPAGAQVAGDTPPAVPPTAEGPALPPTTPGPALPPTLSEQPTYNRLPSALSSGRPWYAATTSALQPPPDPTLQPAAGGKPNFLVTPAITVKQGWTDNVLLTANNRKSDFITTINPTLNVAAKSRRYDVSVNYDLGYDSYAEHGGMTGLRHRGLAAVTSELIDQTFFIDARTSISEQNVKPTGAQAVGDRRSPSSTTQVMTSTISPRLVHQFGSYALAGLSLTHDETSNQSSSNSTSSATSRAINAQKDTTSNRVKFELRNGEGFSKLLWDYSTNMSRTAQGGGNILLKQEHQLSTEYKVSDSLGILATVGDDYIHGLQLNSQKFSGLYYSGGLHWNPAPDADFRVGVGRRFAQSNVFALVSYLVGPRTILRLSRDAGVGTDATYAIDNLNGLQRDASGAYVNPFSGVTANPSSQAFARTSSVYRNETTTLLLTRQEERDTFSLSVSMAKQEIVSGGGGATASVAIDGTPIANSSTVVNSDFTWSHKLTPALSGKFNVTFSDVIEASLPSAKIRRLTGGLGLNYQANETLSGGLDYRISDTAQPFGTAATAATQGGHVMENAFFAQVRKEF